MRDIILYDDLVKIVHLTKTEKSINKPSVRVGIVMLFLLGVRITELKQITILNLKGYLNNQPLYITPGKTKSPVKIPHVASEVTKKVFLDLVGQDFSQLEKQLNPLDSILPWSRGHLNRTLNKVLKSYGHLLSRKLRFRDKTRVFQTRVLGKNFLCHSCRISFITRICQVASVNEAKDLVGNQNISTTQRYNRSIADLERRT